MLQERLLCEQKALEFTARKVLHMVLSSFSTDRCALEQVTIANLMAVRWHPPFDASAQKFHDDWVDVLSRISGDLAGQHKWSLLWAQVRQCDKVAYEARQWKQKSDEERTYEELWQCFKTYLGDVRDAQRYDKLLSAVPKAPAPHKQKYCSGYWARQGKVNQV